MQLDRPKVILAAVLIVLAFLYVNLRSLSAPLKELPYSNDFAHYYLTSRLWLAGQDPYAEPFGDLYQRNGLINRPTIDHATNPPALIVAFAPLALLPGKVAYWVWMVLQLALSAVSVAILLRHFRGGCPPAEYLLILALLLSSFPFVSNFEVAQVQPLLLFLISLGLGLTRSDSRRCQLVGVMLWGGATSLKLFTWPLLYPVILFWGVPGLVAFALGVSFLHLPFLFQPELLLSFVGQALPNIYQLSSVFHSGVGLSGAFLHSVAILGFDSSSTEVIKSLLVYLTPLLALVVLLFDFVAFRRRGTINSTVSVGLIVSCLFAATGWSHYLILLIVPLLALYSVARVAKGSTNLVEVTILLCLFGFTQGRHIIAEPIWQLVTSWWGVFCMGYMLVLLWRHVLWRSRCDDSAIKRLL